MKVSECCGAAWDEDIRICMDCKEHCGYVHDNDYDHYEEMAEENEWTVPVNDVFDDDVWIRYWQAMESRKEGYLEGRPVAPHRSG